MKNNIFKKFKRPVLSLPKGFTIIELVISIFVLSIAVVGIFNALSVIIILTSDSSDRLTATYLAQEGMEIVRNIRDTNWLNMDAAPITGDSYSWGNGLYLVDQTPIGVNCKDNYCEADYKASALSVAPNVGNYLKINSSVFYGYDLNNANPIQTKFKRRIIVEPIADVDGITSPYHILKVKVQVSWDKKSTILGESVLADKCCPGGSDCPMAVSNCVTTQGTLYNWYNTNILVKGVQITNDSGVVITESEATTLSLGDEVQLLALINPDNATNQGVTWRPMAEKGGVTDASCVSVTANGLVKAVDSGCDAYVEVKTADGGFSWTIYFLVNT